MPQLELHKPDLAAELVNCLDIEDEKGSVVDLLCCCHAVVLYIRPRCRENDWSAKMHQSKVIVPVAVLGLSVLLFDEREDIAVTKSRLTT